MLRGQRQSEARLQRSASGASGELAVKGNLVLLWRYLQLGLPGGLMLGLEAWSFELQVCEGCERAGCK